MKIVIMAAIFLQNFGRFCQKGGHFWSKMAAIMAIFIFFKNPMVFP